MKAKKHDTRWMVSVCTLWQRSWIVLANTPAWYDPAPYH